MKKAFLLFAISCSLLQEGKLQNLYSRKQVFLDKLEKNIKSYSALKQLLSEYTTFDRRFEHR